jgi:hypothetical protein
MTISVESCFDVVFEEMIGGTSITIVVNINRTPQNQARHVEK